MCYEKIKLLSVHENSRACPGAPEALKKADSTHWLGLSLLFVESLGSVLRERAGLSVMDEEDSINLSITTEGTSIRVKTALTCLYIRENLLVLQAGKGGSEKDRCEELVDSSLNRIPKPLPHG